MVVAVALAVAARAAVAAAALASTLAFSTLAVALAFSTAAFATAVAAFCFANSTAASVTIKACSAVGLCAASGLLLPASALGSVPLDVFFLALKYAAAVFIGVIESASFDTLDLGDISSDE
jgi:hypothetical protein